MIPRCCYRLGLLSLLVIATKIAIEKFIRKRFNVPNPARSVVIITGASSGIGHHAALYLARNIGFTVFAGVRKQEDLDACNRLGIPTLKPIILDIAKENQIIEAVATVNAFLDANNMKLAALVNNAGVGGEGTVVEDTSIEQMKSTFEVNVFATVNMTKHFLPRLRQDQGRVVTVGSVAGVVSPAGMATYSGSKFAVEAFNDSLRRELLPFGVSVSVINPGVVQTNIFGKFVAGQANVRKTSGVYKPYYDKEEARQKTLIERSKHFPLPSATTTPAITRAIMDMYPQTRYVVSKSDSGIPGTWICWMAFNLPTRLFDMLMK